MSNTNDNRAIFLQVRDLLIQFQTKNKKHQAVKGVSFDIYKGEMFSIVGESGSGKTTIARAIAGVQPIKDGTVYMNDTILRGSAPSLYNITKTINHELHLLEHNNSWITKNLNNYVNNLKITYYRYFANKKYHPLTKEITSYENQNFIFTSDSDVSAPKILKFNKSERYFAICQNSYQENLTILKNITKKYQRINTFLFKLNDYIPDFPVQLEDEIISRNKVILDLIQTHILLANKIYKLILKLAQKREHFEKHPTIANAQNWYHDSFAKLQTLISYHDQFRTQTAAIIAKQKVATILLTPPKKRRKVLASFHQKYGVNKSDLDKAYQEYIVSGHDDNKQQQKAVVTVNNKFAQLALKMKLPLAPITTLLTQLRAQPDLTSEGCRDLIKAYVATLTKSPETANVKTYLLSLVKKGTTPLNVIVKLQDVQYLLKHNVFRDYDTVHWYYATLKATKMPYTRQQIAAVNAFWDLLELPAIDKIVALAPLFQVPKRQQIKKQKQKIQMIFQDPYSSLNDRIAISEVIGEGLNSFPELYQNEQARKWYCDHYNANLPPNEQRLTLAAVKDKDVKYFLILHMLQEVGLLPEHLSRYAHEFSGGQKQRIGIARALIMNPELVIADEPISALDVSIRSQILNLLRKFQKLNNLTYLFIAHDLSIVRFISDRIAVMYNGQIVELAPAEELFKNPLHPYTKALLSAIPQPNPQYEKNRLHFIYEPAKEHYDYAYDLPDFVEIVSGHYVHANSREVASLQATIKVKRQQAKLVTNLNNLPSLLLTDEDNYQRKESEQYVETKNRPTS